MQISPNHLQKPFADTRERAERLVARGFAHDSVGAAATPVPVLGEIRG